MKLKLTLLFCLAGMIARGQGDTTNANAVKLAKDSLTYFWVGRACPAFMNTEYKYGFKIKCVGCILTKKISKNNNRVERKIDKVYGKNWFQNNRKYFAQ